MEITIDRFQVIIKGEYDSEDDFYEVKEVIRVDNLWFDNMGTECGDAHDFIRFIAESFYQKELISEYKRVCELVQGDLIIDRHLTESKDE